MKSGKKDGSRKKKRCLRSATRRAAKDAQRFLPLLAPLIITAFIYMWQHTRTYIDSLPVEKMQSQKRELAKQNDSLRLRIQELQAPDRIEAIARGKLGMTAPQEYRLIALDEPMQRPGGDPVTGRAAGNDARAGQGAEGQVGRWKIGLLKKREQSGAASEGTPSG